MTIGNPRISDPLDEGITREQYFQSARIYIKEDFGLELTLIELVHMKEYINPSLDCFRQVNEISWLPDIEFEIAERFLLDYYGIIDDETIKNLRLFSPIAFKEYLRMQQEKHHIP